MRILRHLFDFDSARRQFPSATLDAVQRAIGASEKTHDGEIVFAVEGNLSLSAVAGKQTARNRASEVFAHLRIWNTTHRTGVLVYVLLADRAMEIVADCGIAAKVEQDEWDAVCALMQARFAEREYQTGAVAGIEAISKILARHFPTQGNANRDELPDRPVLL